jgi:hypothetical protein
MACPKVVARCVSALALATALAACGSLAADRALTATPALEPPGSATASSLPSTAEPSLSGKVPYARIPSPSVFPWLPPTLDVYAPAGARNLPLVVLFHASPDHHDKDGYGPMAQAIARTGAVVVVPNWGVRLSNSGLLAAGAEPEGVVNAWQQALDESACAVDFSVAHAESWGADPSHLVLVGDSVGANVATVLALKGAHPFPGCASSAGDWVSNGLMLLEGDWILEDISWDALGVHSLGLMPVLTPWTMLDGHGGLPVEFGVTESSRESLRRCDASGSHEWLESHDPDGALADRLRALEAYADNCIDVGEESDVMAAAMTERGLSASVLDFADAASRNGSLAEADLARLAAAVRTLTQR